MEPVLFGVEEKVTLAINEDLLRPFEVREVEAALNQMESAMAPGPDGLPPLFYMQYWSKVGVEVLNAVLAVLNSGKIPENLNHIFLILIPKK